MTIDAMPWFPALTTTGLLALALWLFRQLIATRLTKSVEHDFNSKIESIRSDLRASEERLKAQLREKENDIAALRSGALSVLASRQAALDKRRLEAVDQLWSAYSALAPARTIAAYMSVVKFESAAELTERDPKARLLFEFFGTGFDAKSMELGDAAKARPYVTPMVWAVFTAIHAVIAHSVMRWHVLKGGLGSNDFMDHKAIEKLVLTVLPHYADYFEKHGPSSYYHVLEALDARFLADVQSMLAGAETDRASVVQAAEILRQAQALMAATESEKGAS